MLISHQCNIERICENLTGTDYFQMQHFISESNWDGRSAINQAAIQTSRALPKNKLTGLIIDETGTEKKGTKSVGVGWQYCGNVGKIANSQVAVMACLSNGDFASVVDSRLYLPQDWCNDIKRCEEAGIPLEHRKFKTKLELAHDIIINQLAIGVEFDFVSADAYYGKDIGLAAKIEDLGYLYMLDIHSNQHVFVEEPELFIPEKQGGRGRSPKLPKPNKESISVTEYFSRLSHDDWEIIKVRNTAKGTLKAQFHFHKTFIWNKERNRIEKRLLVIRKIKTPKGFEIKYSFTNANLEQYTKKAIAYMQAQRFFVEHCIKESKYVLGMGQFQTRKWLAWQHQIALNIIVSCFMLTEKLFCFDDLPLLSARDIKEWIGYKLLKIKTDKEMIDLIFFRHLKRQNDINNAYRREVTNVSK